MARLSFRKQQFPCAEKFAHCAGSEHLQLGQGKAREQCGFAKDCGQVDAFSCHSGILPVWDFSHCTEEGKHLIDQIAAMRVPVFVLTGADPIKRPDLFELIAHARSVGVRVTEEEHDAIQAAFHYFRVGGKRHAADEEESLVPRLRASGMDTLEEIDRLESDHREATRLHNSVESLYSQWIENGTLGAEDTRQLMAETSRLSALYSAHIRVEEAVVFSRAAQVPDSQTTAAIGSEFRLRRQ
jgi:hemerythrin-like domain-containing protein